MGSQRIAAKACRRQGLAAGSRSALGSRLRAETRDAHAAAEAAFDLDRRLGSLAAYVAGLKVMEAFHHACDPALALIAPWLSPELREGPARRRGRLLADLAALGETPATPPILDAPLFPCAVRPSHALGVVYVQEGAALGGLQIAAEVRRRLPEAVHASAYFAGEGGATARRWRSLQVILGEWTQVDSPAADRVLVGAHSAFAGLAALCAEEARAPR